MKAASKSPPADRPAPGAGPPLLVCVGHVTLDRFGQELLPGGSALYASSTWQQLGGRAALVSARGPDFAASLLPGGLQATWLDAPATTIFVNRYCEDGRRRQEVEALAPVLSPDLLPGRWRRPRVLFIAPVLAEVDPRAWLAETEPDLAALGIQGLVRRARDTDRGRVEAVPFDWRVDWLDNLDVVFLSDDDCRHQPDLPHRLSERVPLVVFTLARRGCLVYEAGRSFTVGSHPAHELDPTGAGDTFAGGFLYALAGGADSHSAACLAAACASIVIEGLGTRALERLGREAHGRARRLVNRSLRD